jgi:outer membrane protein insertion porin family/translocation and assembly module TamA
VKVQPEVRGYVPLGRRFILAARSTTGLLFPFNYGTTVGDELADALAGENRAKTVRDLQVVYFRGFFSGGPSSNRGYPLHAVSPHGIVPFLSPEVEAQQIARECDLKNPNYDPQRCSIPIGGLSLWELSLELRVSIVGAFSAATFCDASDVSPHRVSLRVKHPHLSCGLGARYDTPVGPIRLDIGYRLPGLQVLEPVDAREEGEPGTLLGLPVAISLGIGEAF